MVRARLAAVVVAVLLALALGAAVAPTALADADAGPVVLAVEEDPEAEDRPPPGPEPVFEDNPFLPPEYDVPWTYGLGLILTAVGVLAIIATALGYWLLVRDDEPSRS